MKYKLINENAAGREDGVSFPFDPANTDYQQYLAWLAEGNEPLPADPIPEPTPIDPVEKLRAFLAANPDVQEILG